MKYYKQFLNEEIKTKEIDSSKFPNSGPKKDNTFFTQGKKDGNFTDDIIETKRFNIPAKRLKPSQDAIYLSKSIAMAINNLIGGDLKAMVSKDNYILDGHHRWAATMFGNPNAKIQGMQSNLTIGDLIPVLRKAGDSLGNERGTEPKGGDINIFKASIEDIEDAIYNGKNMNPKYFNKDAAIAWFENIGKETIEKRLKLIQSNKLPKGAPARKDMPKIEPEQVAKIASDLNGGKIDVLKPYLVESKHKFKLNDFVFYKKRDTRKMIYSFEHKPTNLEGNIHITPRYFVDYVDFDNEPDDDMSQSLEVFFEDNIRFIMNSAKRI